MTDDLFHQDGPEGRNVHAAAFEKALAAMGAELGWDLVWANVDVRIGATPGAGRGIDQLWSVLSPLDGRQQGWLLEGKRRCSTVRAAGELDEHIHVLRDKVVSLEEKQAFKESREIRSRRLAMVGGLLAYHIEPFEPERFTAALQDIEPRGNQEGVNPTRVLLLTPETLNGLAEAFRRCGAPSTFFWPPTSRGHGAWSTACPPQQLAHGLLAWRNDDHESILWLRQSLSSHDLDGLDQIAHSWGIDFAQIAFTKLDNERWRLVAGEWASVSESSHARPIGRLPSEATRLNTTPQMFHFEGRWPAT